MRENGLVGDKRQKCDKEPAVSLTPDLSPVERGTSATVGLTAAGLTPVSVTPDLSPVERGASATVRLNPCPPAPIQISPVGDALLSPSPSGEGRGEAGRAGLASPSSLEGRREVFRREVMAYEDRYDRAMLSYFFDYWTEPNRSETKMRFEMERTWKLSLRLSTWARRDRTYAARRPHPSESRFGCPSGSASHPQGGTMNGVGGGGASCPESGTLGAGSLFGSGGASCPESGTMNGVGGGGASCPESGTLGAGSLFGGGAERQAAAGGFGNQTRPSFNPSFNQPYSQSVNHGYSRCSYDALERADREARRRGAAELIARLATENRPYQG